jgi:hypothetical protein
MVWASDLDSTAAMAWPGGVSMPRDRRLVPPRRPGDAIALPGRTSSAFDHGGIAGNHANRHDLRTYWRHHIVVADLVGHSRLFLPPEMMPCLGPDRRHSAAAAGSTGMKSRWRDPDTLPCRGYGSGSSGWPLRAAGAVGKMTFCLDRKAEPEYGGYHQAAATDIHAGHGLTCTLDFVNQEAGMDNAT